LDHYFSTGGAALDSAEMDLSGASQFERRVFAELVWVPAGEVVTYGELAARLGSPGGARAVGAALGRNPLPIFVPCHRVVAAGGRLGGFSAGPQWKRRLLSHEGWTIKEDKIMRKEPGKAAPRVAVYAGSFDPPTMGHMYMIERGAALFDRLIVAVGVNPHKAYTFGLAERLQMLRECVSRLENVEVDSFEGEFLVRYARGKGASFLVRGIRTEEDYRFEHTMRNVNEDLEPGITAVFLIPPREICEVSSSFVKGLIGFGGWQEIVKPYVPDPVYQRLLVGDVRFAHPGPVAEGPAD
jgi:pantetheine-phosphate adenylyltransferase